MSDPLPKVLSVQSHVVFGYVGNKSATFPLQLLGFEVDAINSVQLSNHTKYKFVQGQVLDEDDLGDPFLGKLMDGLRQNDLDHYSHLLTGYVGSASFLKKIGQLVHDLKKKNPDLIYVCDPVMGDNGKMYVPKELLEIYRDEIIPLADILTPNQFELELLTGKKVNNISEVQNAIEILHGKGPKTVVVSSTEIGDDLITVASALKEGIMIKLEIPRLPVAFTGSGDLFAALLLAHSHLQGNIKLAIEKTVNTLYHILKRTYEFSLGNHPDSAQPSQKIELRLIESKKIIENPPSELVAEIL
ncbi:pyridoxal kinase isoform X1 [Athalia rosae]|uniref:pyridoxal kinase isoform X1 n=1 Tax=Athalia rosae TaxID=37344 RepID=UPI00203361D8|nr:pyridoxal kinase isoform X1 [Athalia rosae]